ncbi:MAG: TIGR00730 family Rossman fold protein [Steroidobacteraceae bacterium]
MASPSEPHAPVAYLDASFLESEAARPLRILAEYLEPMHKFASERIKDTIVFFGSARLTEQGSMGRYYAEARTLSKRITEWSATLDGSSRRYVVCSGGGGGIMEAANRGAQDAGGRSIGLNISLPHEQRPNPYVTPDLSFEFHYFFMRKLWFAHLARALVVFPGGFGTLDELTEILTLAQTRKLDRTIPILLYGPDYWHEVINFDALVRHGMISAEDLGLIEFVDDPESAMVRLRKIHSPPGSDHIPAFAHSRHGQDRG